jgi:hypothetical protein
VASDIALPPDYVPYAELVICGNWLINGQVPFVIGGEAPLLIGKGPIPQVWLKVPMSVGGKDWEYLVQKNKVTWPAVRPFSSLVQVLLPLRPDQNTVEVHYTRNRILRVRSDSETKATVEEIDLRIFGINIVGDKSGLNVASNNFVANHFENVRTMIAIG